MGCGENGRLIIFDHQKAPSTLKRPRKRIAGACPWQAMPIRLSGLLSKGNESAISPKRGEDFPEWYQQVVRAAELAENSEVRGCMVIRPWGYALWERMQGALDAMFKATGHRNADFPSSSR